MTKERIEIIRRTLIPFVKKVLLEINYEDLGKSDAKEFEKDLNEILDLAIQAQEQPTSEDCVSRKAVDQNIYDYAESNGLSYANLKNAILDVPLVTPTFPEGTTNGDIMTAMFPDIKIREHEKTDICDAYIQIDIWDFSICVSKDWWDEPYKRGSEA